MADGNLEKLLRGGLPASPRHKETLRARLFEGRTELSIDDLEQVAGGVMPEEPKLLDWPDEGMGQNTDLQGG